VSEIYGEDDEDAPRLAPTSLTGGGAVVPRPQLPREGGTGVWEPPPPPDASPFYREAVPRHAVTPNGVGHADATVVPANLITPGERGGGPVYAFPYDPRRTDAMGSLNRVLYPEEVVAAALNDGTHRIPDYLGAWMIPRAEAHRLPPPEWLMRRLYTMARQGNQHAAALYNHGIAVAKYLATS
jgi:hypothetical protein